MINFVFTESSAEAYSVETEALIEIGKDVILFYQNGPDAHCEMYDGSWIAFFGVQGLADLNMIGITASVNKDKFDEILNEAAERRVDAILFVASDASDALVWAAEKALPSKTYDDPAIDLWMAKTKDDQPLSCAAFMQWLLHRHP